MHSTPTTSRQCRAAHASAPGAVRIVPAARDALPDKLSRFTKRLTITPRARRYDTTCTVARQAHDNYAQSCCATSHRRCVGYFRLIDQRAMALSFLLDCIVQNKRLLGRTKILGRLNEYVVHCGGVVLMVDSNFCRIERMQRASGRETHKML